MLIVEGESLADGMLFQAAWGSASRIRGVVTLARLRGRVGGSRHILHGLLAFLGCPCAPGSVTVPCFLSPAESPPERCGQRRSMPSGISEKNPTMEPAATTPFRVTVSVSPLRECCGILISGLGGCQRGEELAHPERRSAACEPGWLLVCGETGWCYILLATSSCHMCPGRAVGFEWSLEQFG